jgi:cell division protease FtsH
MQRKSQAANLAPRSRVISFMLIPLEQYTAAHRRLLAIVAERAGMAEPIAFTAPQHMWPLLRAARKRALVPVDGVLVRDWSAGNRHAYSGVQLGIRLYEIEQVLFANVQFIFEHNFHDAGINFLAVDSKDYRKLYRIAHRLLEEQETAGAEPILHPEQADRLWNNTIGFLDSARLARIKEYGGRARRGVLLTGPPGNGKTMACRWIWEECCRRNWEYRIVTPSSYQEAKRKCSAETAVRALFSVQRRGVIFFDDMDLALRDRETVDRTEDQAVFLTALDGITIREGVVYVFTTNCPLESIDRAFKRPGRIDVAFRFEAPDAALRRRLIARWHANILERIDAEAAVDQTQGFSFAEVEELRNLLIMRHADTGLWDWAWALEQFGENREDLRAQLQRAMGFSMPALARTYVGAPDDE